MADPVTLHVYDLSMGMARQMSGAILGTQIDLIPHTGVVVRGKELFFGGGIQSVHPHEVVEFYGLQPTERLPLGNTSKTDAELRAFLRSISHRYTMGTYDLFTNNCNNFSNEVCQFLLGISIPSRIIDIPSIVLRSPLGPMIGQMMNGMNANMGQRAGSNDPFAALAGGRVPGTSRSDSATASVAASPIPSLPSPSSVLSKATAALISGDAGGVSAFLKRFKDAMAASDGMAWEGAEEEKSLDDMAAALAARAADVHSGEGQWQKPVCTLLARALARLPHATAAFPIFALARLLVLREDCVPHLTASADPAQQGHSGPLLQQALTLLNLPGGDITGTASANLLLLTTLANTCGSAAGKAWATSPAVLTRLLDGACTQLRAAKQEMRLLAAALALNLANAIPAGSDSGSAVSTAEGDATVQIGDSSVQLLCAVLDGIDAEGQDEVAKRRLLAAGRVLVHQGHEACGLASTLGYEAPVRALACSTARTAEVRALAAEVLALINSPPHGA